MSHDDIRDRAVDLLRRYGSEAGLEAACMADAALERHDMDAHRVWLAVMNWIIQVELIGLEARVQ